MSNIENSHSKKVHIIGICGAGMSAVAVLLRESGYEITGSDAGFYDPIYSYLVKQGIEFTAGHSADNIPDVVDIIVIGKHAKLVPETNEEVARAFAFQSSGQVEVLSFPEVLNRLTTNTQNLMVVGSYGKSTCTAMITWCLIQAGKDPSYFVPAPPIDMETTSHIGTGDLFVLEGDEYPSSNWDNSSKFLHYNARNILLTSGEHDHVNMFPKIEDYLKPYQELIEKLPDNGSIVACVDNPNVKELIEKSAVPVATYSIKTQADYCAQDITYGAETTFQIVHGDEKEEFSTPLLGVHNVQNCVGVAAFLHSNNLLSLSEIKKGIASFRGIKRRLDRKNPGGEIPVYEGFGTSYTKAKTAIDAIKLHFPERELIVVFEPHTFSWRDPAMTHWYDDVFDGTQQLFVLRPSIGHGKDTKDQLTLDQILERVGDSVPNKFGSADPDAIFAEFQKIRNEKSVILLLSSGDLGGLIKRVSGLDT